jgi:hypothetical protein
LSEAGRNTASCEAKGERREGRPVGNFRQEIYRREIPSLALQVKEPQFIVALLLEYDR